MLFFYALRCILERTPRFQEMYGPPRPSPMERPAEEFDEFDF